MQINYKEGICKGCSDTKLIVYVSGQLCLYCNQNRLAKRYSKKQAKKSPFSTKAIDSMQKDVEVYKKLWNTKPHFCEECGFALPDVTAEEASKHHKYIFSHILGKGAHPKIRRMLDNFNLLCQKDHDEYEFGDREKMKIFVKNKPVILRLLKTAYHGS